MWGRLVAISSEGFVELSLAIWEQILSPSIKRVYEQPGVGEAFKKALSEERDVVVEHER